MIPPGELAECALIAQVLRVVPSGRKHMATTTASKTFHPERKNRPHCLPYDPIRSASSSANIHTILVSTTCKRSPYRLRTAGLVSRPRIAAEQRIKVKVVALNQLDSTRRAKADDCVCASAIPLPWVKHRKVSYSRSKSSVKHKT
jgi:hypothetical protein